MKRFIYKAFLKQKGYYIFDVYIFNIITKSTNQLISVLIAVRPPINKGINYGPNMPREARPPSLIPLMVTTIVTGNTGYKHKQALV